MCLSKRNALSADVLLQQLKCVHICDPGVVILELLNEEPQWSPDSGLMMSLSSMAASTTKDHPRFSAK